MRPARYSLAALVVACLSTPSVATAQSDVGPFRIGTTVSGSLNSGHSAPTIGVSASYRLADGRAVEGDLSYFSDLTLANFSTDAGPSSIHAGTTSGTANLVYTVPAGVRWVRPYVLGGGGAAKVRREVNSAFCPCSTRNDVHPAVTAGGGVDFMVYRGLAVGVDFRYERVFEDESLFRPNLRNLKRVGTFIGYRF